MKKEDKKGNYISLYIVLLVAIIIFAVFIILNNKNTNKNNVSEDQYTNRNSHTTFIHPDKPIIYIYPKEEMEVNVKLGRTEYVTHTYPKYRDGWNVIAKTNGDLIDKETQKSYYALYWEAANIHTTSGNDGFVVKGEDTISFLEEKLTILGLNSREINEFIIYWLPKLENNKYNFIRFQTLEEINANMPLEINPLPDSIIRVMMEFKELENYIEVTEQKLITPKREGFTVVEWGGSEI